MMALQILFAFSHYLQYELLGNLEKGIVEYDDAQSNDTRQQFIAIIIIAMSIVSAVTFIQWFRRAYFNLHTVSDGLKYSEGWAAGAWFVPILNLFRPYQIMRELFDVSSRVISEKMGGFHPKPYLNAVNFWWALWIISNVIANLTFRLMPNSGSIEDLKTETVVSIFTSLLEVPLALITVKVIKLYAEQEEVLNDAVQLDINTIGAETSTHIQ
jgi:hypothetical protein